jgi:hypothetical protein
LSGDQTTACPTNSKMASDDYEYDSEITSEVQTEVNLFADSIRHPVAPLSESARQFLIEQGEVLHTCRYHIGWLDMLIELTSRTQKASPRSLL